MFYSRFDERAGVYDIFQDGAQRAVNADLPVPDLPSEVNGIGVPASEAGRPLPREARIIGQSWSPKGIIVTPRPRGSGMGDGDFGASGIPKVFAMLAIGAAGTAALIYWVYFTGPSSTGRRK